MVKKCTFMCFTDLILPAESCILPRKAQDEVWGLNSALKYVFVPTIGSNQEKENTNEVGLLSSSVAL